jgi:hypothetical protein
MTTETVNWLLTCDEPWTRYRTLVDLLGCSEDDPDVAPARSAMLAHPQVKALLAEASAWPGPPLTRHNDAGHVIYKLSTLADFGVIAAGEGMDAVLQALLAHQSAEGAFQSVVAVPEQFGGSGQDQWAWLACDSPTLLYVLVAMGKGEDPRTRHAMSHLATLSRANGWGCAAAPQLGKFHGPGRRSDPCPIANVYALKALAQSADYADSPATQVGAEAILHLWEQRRESRPYLFAMGTDFCKLKYPFVWYDILHVASVLAQYPFARRDARFIEMVNTITSQADDLGRHTATSMYRSWQGWSFADKKRPSPWLTFLILRLEKWLAQSSV